jgi:hypothetical protein
MLAKDIKKKILLAIQDISATGWVDTSTNPLYWNKFHGEHGGRQYEIYVQRWVRGRRRCTLHYITIRYRPSMETLKKDELKSFLAALENS